MIYGSTLYVIIYIAIAFNLYAVL